MADDSAKEEENKNRDDATMLNAFRQWMRRLDWDDLQNAMEFCVDHDSIGSGSGNCSTHPHKKQPHRSEYELLSEMVCLQRQLDTPTHPRAVPFLPASVRGRSYKEERVGSSNQNRLFHHHQQQPPLRLLQLIPRSKSSKTTQITDHRDTNSTTMDAAEAALLVMLSMEGGVGSASHCDNNPKARTKLRHGNSPYNNQIMMEKNKHRMAASSQTETQTTFDYDVMARQFRQADGQVLSVASTFMQQQADHALLTGTVVVCGLRVGERASTTSVAMTSYTCRLDLNRVVDHQSTTTSSTATADERKWKLNTVWNMLRVASRGNLGTTVVTAKATTSTPNSSVPIFASWFDPEERWFPLSMYLACRFEVALWKAFYQQLQQQQQATTNNKIAPSLLFPKPAPSLLESTLKQKAPFHQLSDRSLLTLYEVSLALSIKEILMEGERTLLLPSKCHLRDSELWNLLSDSRRFGTINRPLLSGRCLVEDLWLCALTELDSHADKWRRRLRDRMQLLVSEHHRKLLLQDLEGISDEPKKSTNTAKFARRSKIRKKVKQKNVGESIRGHQNEDDHSTASIDDGDDAEEARMDNRVGMPYQRSKQPKVYDQASESRSNCVSGRERNRNTVLVLSVLEDVLTGVFRQVGLSSAHTLDTQNKSETVGLSYVEKKSHNEPFLVVGRGGATSNPGIKTGRPKHDLPKAASRHESVGIIAPRKKNCKKKKKPTTVRSPEPERCSTENLEEPADELVWAFDGHRLFPPIRQGDDQFLIAQQYPHFHHGNFFVGDPSATIRRSNLQGFSTGGHEALSPGFFHRQEALDGGASWEMPGYSAVDGWASGLRGLTGRDESILTEFFHTQENDGAVMASSTAASIASSSDKEGDSAIESSIENGSGDDINDSAQQDDLNISSEQQHLRIVGGSASPIAELLETVASVPSSPVSEHGKSAGSESDFHSPSPPSTPSPTLSPIVVSLSELSHLNRESLKKIAFPSARSLSSEPAHSRQLSMQERFTVPNMVSSRSRDNLRTSLSAEEHEGKGGAKMSAHATDTWIYNKSAGAQPSKSRDDHDIIDKATVRRSADALSSYRNLVLRPGTSRDDHDLKVPVKEAPPRNSSYRNVAARAFVAASFSKSVTLESSKKAFGTFHFESMSSDKQNDSRLCTRSETAFDGEDDFQTWHEAHTSKNDEIDSNAISKDGILTISSETSRREPEEILMLREQRNTYRDMCLTLGADVAKLKNLLAAQKNSAIQPTLGIQPGYGYHPFRNAGPFDPVSVNHSFYVAPRARTLAAMSDAGYRGEQESLASEDDVAAKMLASESLRQVSSGVTVSESDASVGHHIIHMPNGVQPARNIHDVASFQGMQSRLARDIFQFLETTNTQLRKLDGKIQAAVERMNRLVKTVWPRAQVKLYGSHVTGLCVPSSDLDFVVCLPAVHKNAVADAPGALEGRNAINETSQKLLARRLKGESWIDPRSMKLIDRTVVPVIKVATKDTKKQTLHLDISFDAPGHHGLAAAQMITSIMGELPLLRPLVVVLKQFLIERSLLEAYTGMFDILFVCLDLARDPMFSTY